MKHLFTSSFSRRTNREIKTIRKPTSIKVYRDESNDKIISFTDLEVLKFHRENKIGLFFETYKCCKKYTLVEYVLDYNDADKIDRFFFSLKKSLKENGMVLLGYIRLIDIGYDGGVHHHIAVALPKIDVTGKSFPAFLKRNFNGRKVHGEFVRNRQKLKNYYTPKDIIELGLRKRTFVKSHKFMEIDSKSNNIIQNVKFHNLSKVLKPISKNSK